MPETFKVPVKEKIGYAMGDIATNFFFQSMILYQTRFYTDTAGISAVAVSYMFFILRWSDAYCRSVRRGFSDRTRTRWGKFRPWILCTAVPFGLSFGSLYVTPDSGPRYETYLRLHHLCTCDDDVLRQQHALLRAYGSDDTGRQRTQQHRWLSLRGSADWTVHHSGSAAAAGREVR